MKKKADIASDDISLLATDFFVCERCIQSALIYHKIYHLRYNTFKNCEKKLEHAIIEHPEIQIETTIAECIKDKDWLHNIITEHLEMCRMNI